MIVSRIRSSIGVPALTSEAVTPGATALIRTPLGPNSTARFIVALFTAALDDASIEMPEGAAGAGVQARAVTKMTVMAISDFGMNAYMMGQELSCA